MQQISNNTQTLTLTCEDDGTQMRLHDERRGITWQLDDSTRRLYTAAGMALLGNGQATRLDPATLRQAFEAAGMRITLLWEMLADGVAVTLSAAESETPLQAIALPGAFAPVSGPLQLALPIMQGVLFDGRGEAFEQTLGYGGHEMLSMAMLGYLHERGGLLLSIEDYADWRGVVGNRSGSGPYAFAEQTAALGALRYPRHAHLYPTDPGLTALCKRYRQRVQVRGEWKGWAEKIAERPAVEHLFGALMTFIGYNHSDIDYVAGCRRLRDMGFERALIYPVRFNTPSPGFLMGGDPPIDLSDAEIAAIQALGYDVAPWAWVFEALDDGSAARRHTYRRDAAGATIPGWKIDQYQWHLCCTPFQSTFARASYAERMHAMTWAHYDVNATVSPLECYALDHEAHAGHALDRRNELTFLRQLLGPATNGNRIVSSEGFRDCLTNAYDIGSTKLLPACGPALFWTAPMTMLVYHDSTVHDWWEMHNYNLHAERAFDHASRWGNKTSGHAQAKAAMDALYGCPPNVFPFGRQYRWVDFDARRTASYTVRLDDADVQAALAAALPVTQLHRRIGKLEMLSHEFLSADGALQTTTFADGTRVVANLSDAAQEGYDAFSWRVEKP